MPTIQSLSKEVLLRVFRSLNSLESIAECRMVCKSWNDLAAIAMFQKPLHLCLYDQTRAKNLLQYLATNQAIGQHVAYLSICHYDNNILQAILPLLFTPNIRELSDDNPKDNLYTLITEIAQKPNAKFDKLNAIPSPYYFTDRYSTALWTFRKSLTTIHITIHTIPNPPTHLIYQLSEFKRLTTLTLDAPLDNVEKLEQMIGGCLQLQHLKLSTLNKIENVDTLPDNTTTTLSACQLDSSSILQINSLKTLNIVSTDFPCFFPYLMFKYPNTQSITLNIHETDTYITECINQLIQPLKKVANYSFTYKTTVGDAAIATVFDATKSNVNIVKIGYHHEFEDVPTIVMAIEGIQTQESNHQTIFSMRIPPNAITITHAGYLLQIQRPIGSLEVDLLSYRDFDMNGRRSNVWKKIAVDDEVVVVFDILFSFPETENFKFITRDISDCANSCFFKHHTRLKSLEICGAKLDSVTFLAFADLCPNLRVLTLINCHILHQDGIVRINMEHIAFQQLTYQLKPCNYFICDMGDSDNREAIEWADKALLELEIHYSTETYLCLQTKKTRRAMFLIIMPNDSCKCLITKSQFDSRPPEAPAIQISCFSVEHVLLDLDSIHLQMDEEYIAYALTNPLSSVYDSP